MGKVPNFIPNLRLLEFRLTISQKSFLSAIRSVFLLYTGQALIQKLPFLEHEKDQIFLI